MGDENHNLYDNFVETEDRRSPIPLTDTGTQSQTWLQDKNPSLTDSFRMFGGHQKASVYIAGTTEHTYDPPFTARQAAPTRTYATKVTSVTDDEQDLN